MGLLYTLNSTFTVLAVGLLLVAALVWGGCKELRDWWLRKRHK